MKMDMPVPVTENVFWIGVNDRETHLFEGMWPLPHGVSYNSYLIKDEKVVLVDTVKFTLTGPYLEKLRKLTGGRIDYLVVNHMEPDHSGSILALRDIYPDMVIIGNKKTEQFLYDFYGITDGIKVVKDAEELDIGSRKLIFYMTPMVHWPETMMTYDTKDRILFSGDAFGGFRTLDGGIFDDELDVSTYRDEIARYYANIIAKFSPMVQAALGKLKGIDIRVVCSTHGPVWRKDPGYIVKYYDELSCMETEHGVVVVYGSMYGNTKKMADHLARRLSEGGIEKVIVHDASKTHLSYLIRDIWRYTGIAIGTPTYNTGIYPPIDALVHFMKNSRIQNHVIGVFGSCGWGGGGVKAVEEYARSSSCRVVDPVVEVHGRAKEEDLKRLDELAENMVRELKELSCK